jgi:hypothetical protein
MAVIYLPRDEHGRVLDPMTGELIFDPVTRDQRIKNPAIIGPLSVVVLEPGETPYFPPGWEPQREL